VPQGAAPQELDKLRRLAAEIARKARDEPSNFGKLAQRYSQDMGSAAKGGDIGWLTEEEMRPKVRDILGSLGPGEVSTPILSKRGWHIFRLIARKTASPKTFTEAAPEIRELMRRQKTAANHQRFIEDLQKKCEIYFTGVR